MCFIRREVELPRRFSAHFLWRIRNEISIEELIGRLGIPTKHRDGCFRFLCPVCSEFHTATLRDANLARCFRCCRNFNTIEMTMVVEGLDFVECVNDLGRRLVSGGVAHNR